jgi:hypothetical protein
MSSELDLNLFQHCIIEDYIVIGHHRQPIVELDAAKKEIHLQERDEVRDQKINKYANILNAEGSAIIDSRVAYEYIE